jgi:dihydrofolate reductase
MSLSIIAALSQNRVIGKDNQLPWHLPADLKHFKSLTLGKPVVMGRKTYESIGKPLPERRNIVVSRNLHYTAAGCEVVASLEHALALAGENQEVMLIGGAQLFEQAMPLVDCMYLTLIHQDFEGDCFFPQWQQHEWKELMRVDCTSHGNEGLPFSFVTLKRY